MANRILFVDCFSGASGDMWLGALVDLGVPPSVLEGAVRGLKLPPWSLACDSVQRCGITGTKVTIHVTDPTSGHSVEPLGEHGTPPHHHGITWAQIRGILEEAELSEPVRNASLRTFRLLAEAEAHVHGVTPDGVHFHEVGAADALIDVVATCAGVLSLQVDEVIVSPIPSGTGTVKCAHGEMPVPVPATEALLRGWSTYGTNVSGEMVTPTGAALLRSLGTSNGRRPAMRVESTGYGAGAKDFPTQPNLLRLQLGHTEPTDAQLVMLETQMDDINPEWLPPLRKKLLESGARDVWMTSISMKKERQGSLLSILCKPEHSADLRSTLFRESTTFGIREYPVTRYERESSFKTVESPFGACRVRCSEEGEFPLFVPEYEDCLELSHTHSVPLRVVYEAVTAAAKAAFSPSTGEQP